MFFDDWSISKRLLVCLAGYAVLALLALLALFGARANAGLAGLLALLFAANSVFLYRAALLPLRETNRQFARFNQGYDATSIFARTTHFSAAEKQAFAKIAQFINNNEVNRVSNRHAQYLALQNQINPHFLYNTLEAIRGDALSEGMENIAGITEALATFFRYTISNVDNLVTLEEELSNAENYFAIQNYRFGDRISMQVDFERGSEAARDFKLPKLTLQPIIENAIIHGLEHKVGSGKVTVRIDSDAQRLMIEVTDDGGGMSEAMLDEINSRLLNSTGAGGGEERARSGGIALINVDNRIKLLFGERYGLCVSSIQGQGTRVDISLPVNSSRDRR